jgi:hypothetical protein
MKPRPRLLLHLQVIDDIFYPANLARYLFGPSPHRRRFDDA